MNGAPSEPRTSCRRRKSARRRSAAIRDDLEHLDPEPCTSSRSVDNPKPAGLPGSFREPAAAKAGTWRVAAGPAIFRFPGHCRGSRQGRAARGTISAGLRFLRSASSPCPARLRLGGAFLWDGLPHAGDCPLPANPRPLATAPIVHGRTQNLPGQRALRCRNRSRSCIPTSLAPVPFYAERYFGALRRPFSQPSRPRVENLHPNIRRRSPRDPAGGARAGRRACSAHGTRSVQASRNTGTSAACRSRACDSAPAGRSRPP